MFVSEGKGENMKKVSFPIPIGPFYKSAKEEIEKILAAAKIKVSTIILDDWNNKPERGIIGPRLIYGEPFASDCMTQCGTCPLFLAVGEDNPEITGVTLRTSLCKATPEQREWLPSVQQYLNCKTLDQFGAAYVAFFRNIKGECGKPEIIREKLLAELLWVSQFRIIRHAGFTRPEHLRRLEGEIKFDIVTEVVGRFRAQCEIEYARFVKQTAKSFGLI